MRFRCETFRIASMVCGSSVRTSCDTICKNYPGYPRCSAAQGCDPVRGPVACSAQLHQFTGRSAAAACPHSPPPCSWIWTTGESLSASLWVWNSLRCERFRSALWWHVLHSFPAPLRRPAASPRPPAAPRSSLAVLSHGTVLRRCSCALNPLFSRYASLLSSVCTCHSSAIASFIAMMRRECIFYLFFVLPHEHLVHVTARPCAFAPHCSSSCSWCSSSWCSVPSFFGCFSSWFRLSSVASLSRSTWLGVCEPPD